MTTLTRDTKSAILSGRLKTEVVEVPEWGEGVAVIVSEMSGAARDVFYAGQDGKTLTVSEQQARLLIATLVDESGALLLDETDIDHLRTQGAGILDRLGTVAMRVNGMQPKATEEAAKNSEAAQSGDSGSV